MTYPARACTCVPSTQSFHEAFRRFRRIILTLRSHGRGGLARCCKKIDHARVLQGELGQALLARLLADGILRRSGSFYHWDPAVAAQLVGISWAQLQSGTGSNRLTEYLIRFLETSGFVGYEGEASE